MIGLALVHRVLQGRPAVRTPRSRHIGAGVCQDRNDGCIARAAGGNQSGLYFVRRGASYGVRDFGWGPGCSSTCERSVVLIALASDENQEDEREDRNPHGLIIISLL